jgi:hypothetical protein
MTAQQLAPFLTAAIVALVLALRVRNLRRVRRLRLETLWIVPAVLAVAFAFATWEYPPPDALGWVWLALAAAIGAALGWQRGKLMRIAIDPETHTLNQQSSPAALLFVVLVIVARQGMRYEAAALGINMLKVTGILLAFALGLLAATRAEMFLRARRLLAAARTA